MHAILMLKAALLGVVEGITEFLPISSTGHLIIAGRLVHFDDPAFEVFIQLGAILAVVVIYWQDLSARFRGALREAGRDRAVVFRVLLAFLPAAVIGKLFHHQIKAYLFNPLSVAAALFVGGVAIIWLERQPRALPSASNASVRGRLQRLCRWRGRREPRVTDADSLDTMTTRHALAAGVGQVLAMWPGFSRAAATILGGMLAGCNRTAATQFSFYLAIPTMLGASTLALLSARHDLSTAQIPVYAVGFLVSFVVAWIAIRGLLRYIAAHTFTAFGWYRLVLAAVIVLLAQGLHWLG